MREIKFRGISVETNSFVYGFYLHSGVAAAIYKGHKPEGGMDIEVVQEDTVGQFTGLKDKNGTEIYEGDILHLAPFDELPKMPVVFEDGAFEVYPSAHWSVRVSQHYINKIGLSVIGNIHENPELLEAA